MTFAQRSRRLALAGGLLLATMAMAAPVIGATIAVSIQDRTFSPADVVVHPGDVVTWTVTKSINEPHTVTSGQPTDATPGSIFDSGVENSAKLKDDGGTFSFTFDKAGTYAYFCQIHPDMKGTITVAEAGAAPGGHEGGVPMENRIIGAAILVVTLVVLFGAAIAWRRMNPA